MVAGSDLIGNSLNPSDGVGVGAAASPMDYNESMLQLHSGLWWLMAMKGTGDEELQAKDPEPQDDGRLWGNGPKDDIHWFGTLVMYNEDELLADGDPRYDRRARRTIDADLERQGNELKKRGAELRQRTGPVEGAIQRQDNPTSDPRNRTGAQTSGTRTQTLDLPASDPRNRSFVPQYTTPYQGYDPSTNWNTIWNQTQSLSPVQQLNFELFGSPTSNGPGWLNPGGIWSPLFQ